jgi:very-short-patch-repair endonuclease
VRPDEPAQRAFVAQVNQAIRPCGAELRETAEDGGYPVFTLGTVGAKPAGRPKNIIFASTNKPDLRLVDAINNDIEIATRADEVLVYDEPIGSDGLLWRDLQRWWQERQRVVDETAAKRGLYDRLRSCLPDTSPPQRWLFEAFFKTFKDQVPRLPALLPEVWLHWDPKTMDARRAKREGTLPGHRMDFLLLLPHGGRVVVEVDGSHHFAEKDQRASPRKYAVMMAADRDLRLAGYEVFRFGAAELSSAEDTLTVAAPFFRRLFKANGIET